MSKEKLIGTWKLVSATYRRPNGEAIDYLGAHPRGALMYDQHGNMSIHLMRLERPRFATDDRTSGTPEQAKAALDGYLGYFGTFTLDEGKKTVTHHIEGATFPNWVDAGQTRSFEIVGDQLILRTPTLFIAGGPAMGELVWRRAG
jgi:lipocalin-like protein